MAGAKRNGRGAKKTDLSARPLPAALRMAIGRERIARRIAELAERAAARLKPRERPVAVVVLQGAFVFAADLLRALPPALRLDVAFLRCESYGNATRSRGKVVLLHDLDPALDLHGRAVLLLDDILDTGLTLRFLVQHLRARGAARIVSCVLLEKRGMRRARVPRADLAGFAVPPAFYVGYGMDWAGKYRHLRDLAVLKRATRRPSPPARGRKGRRA